MDNDCTTLAHIHATIDKNLKKKTDTNHTKKSIVNALIEMSTKHKQLKNIKLRNYIVRSIMYTLQQNQGNAAVIEQTLKQITPHMYGMCTNYVLIYLF